METEIYFSILLCLMPKDFKYLSGNGRGGLDVVIGSDDIIGQNDDVALDFFGDALCARGQQTQPYGVAPPQKTHENEE